MMINDLFLTFMSFLPSLFLDLCLVMILALYFRYDVMLLIMVSCLSFLDVFMKVAVVVMSCFFGEFWMLVSMIPIHNVPFMLLDIESLRW